MVGITEISAGLASLNGAKTLLGAMVGVRDATKMNELRIELQDAILTAQQGLFAAQQEHAASAAREDDLKQEIVKLKDWSSEKARYELIAIQPGVFAYMQKAGMRTSEPPHWLCATCFGNGKKAILQTTSVKGSPLKPVNCMTCKAALVVSWAANPAYKPETGDGASPA